MAQTKLFFEMCRQWDNSTPVRRSNSHLFFQRIGFIHTPDHLSWTTFSAGSFNPSSWILPMYASIALFHLLEHSQVQSHPTVNNRL